MLAKSLENGNDTVLTQVIAGEGGIGKTTLAIEYAYAYQAQYDVCLFACAETITTLTGSYQCIASQLALPEATKAVSSKIIVQAVRQYFTTATSATPGKIPFLLILDNAGIVTEDMRQRHNTPLITLSELIAFLPDTCSGHIILTTWNTLLEGRSQSPVNNILTLLSMEPTEARNFLLERKYGKQALLPDSETAAATDLAQHLGYLPLALELVTAYIAADRQQTLASYRDMYKEQEAQHPPFLAQLRISHETSGRISLNAVEAISPAAADLLRLCSFVAPESIPIEFVLTAAKSGEIKSLTEFFGDLSNISGNEQRFTELLGPLLAYSLATTGSMPGTFQIHRLVQFAIRRTMDLEIPNTSDLEKQTARAKFPNLRWITELISGPRKIRACEIWITRTVSLLSQTSWDSVDGTLCERILPHVEALFPYFKDDIYRTVTTALLLDQAASYLYGRGRYGEAEPLYREALTIITAILGSNHPQTKIITKNLQRLREERMKQAE